jgi:hypothetical protein
MLTRFAGLTGAGLLAATALARQRGLDPTCLSCSGRRRPVTSTPPWAIAGAVTAVTGCLVRLGAQAAVGFDSTPYGAGLAMFLFEAGFLLTGVVLPVLLVTRLLATTYGTCGPASPAASAAGDQPRRLVRPAQSSKNQVNSGGMLAASASSVVGQVQLSGLRTTATVST